MHEYDVALKSILVRPESSALMAATGFSVKRWLNVELPMVHNRRADLLGETSGHGIAQIELQSVNDREMALRMLEYAVPIRRKYGRFPDQVVLYVGNAPLRMEGRIDTPQLSFRCRIVDIRDLDGEELLASACLEDNIISILTRLRDERAAVQRILARIAEQDPARRGSALETLMILAGLRELQPVITKEIVQMPILDDIMDTEVLGGERKRGIALGLEQGREQGERAVVLCLLGKRFGPVPSHLSRKIDGMSAPELEALALRLLDAASLEDLFA